MHYCTLLITKEFPTDEVISNIMRPYDEELVEYDDNGNRIGGRPVFYGTGIRLVEDIMAL